MDISSVSGQLAPPKIQKPAQQTKPSEISEEARSVKVSISEESQFLAEAEKKLGIQVEKINLDDPRLLTQERLDALGEQANAGRNSLLKLDSKVESFLEELANTNPDLAAKEFDFSIRANGTLKAISSDLSEKDRLKLEGILNEDRELQNLASELKEITLSAMSKEASARHVYDNIDLEGIAINEETIEEGLHFRSLMDGMKSDYARYGTETNTKAAFSLPLFGIAKELKGNLS